MTLHHTAHHHPVHHEVRHKLEEKVKAAGMHERFITSAAEQQLVSDAVEHGLAADFAANVVQAIAVEKGFVVESYLDHVMAVVLHHLGKKNKGKLEKIEFDEACDMAKDLSHGVVPELKLKKKAKQIMVDNGISADSGGVFHSDWFKAI